MKRPLYLLIVGVSVFLIYSFFNPSQKPVFSAANEIQIVGDYIQQSIVSKDGLQSWYRICPIDLNKPENVTDWGKCTPFQGPVMIDELGLPSYTQKTGIRDISGYITLIDNQPHLHQSLLSSDGKTIWSMSCPVRDTIEWNNCVKNENGKIWSIEKVTDFTLPNGANAIIKNLSELAINVESIDAETDLSGLLTQFLISEDGKMWMRICMTNNIIGLGQCLPWFLENISEMTTGAPIENIKDIEDFSLYAIQKFDKEIEFTISLLHADGDRVYEQKCNIDLSEALNADLSKAGSDMQSVFGCETTWEEAQLSKLFVPPIGFGNKYASFNTYAYQTFHPMKLCVLKDQGDISCNGIKDEEDHALWWTEHTGITTPQFADIDDDGSVTGTDFELLRQKHFPNSP
ncbi:MAG: hypothetical protein US54_C0078G0005 [Candidatus Roizmanbacteria bacterium GW2011_GWA2_37_7]|uniref:Dockerin domain-containing protein n=1 Tax=Candidatus Roizmanbacteria bacterium GW2011_GWA2_37_7 TaxID=1618481 RepID=A0A0G0JHC3_9BACT|nr:MAG: hypothetical protein US54_C0078G0005 [Candidatus Roizmanbacteria bacterium GW2011_GWA2_37_7]